MATGITVRHGRACNSRTGARCNCSPAYESWVWDAKHVDPKTGKRGIKVSKRFGSLVEARSWRGDALPAVRRGTLTAPTKQSLQEYADEWLEKAERGEIIAKHKRPYKPSVLRGYRSDLTRYVYPEFETVRLSEVRRRDLQALVDDLNVSLSGQKVRNIVVAIAAVYRYAVRRDLVAVNPTHDLDLPAPGARRDWSRSPQEAKVLLDALPEDQRALWATALYSGLRRGELRALRVSDVHGLAGQVGDRWISVERGWDDFEGPISPKSVAGVRKALLPEMLRVILAAHVERTGRGGDDLLFGRSASEPFNPSVVRSAAVKVWETAKLEPFTLHECRHGHNSFVDAAGISEARADRYMGHAGNTVGDRYRHELPGQLREDAALLDEYLNRQPAVVVELATGAQTGVQPVKTARLSQAV